MINLIDIQKRLRECMVESGMKLKDIAIKTNISERMVSKYKQGKAIPALDIFAELCVILDVSSDYILGIGEY